MARGNPTCDAAQSYVDGPLRRTRRRFDDGRPPACVEDLARGHGRRAADEEMTKADQKVDSAADKLETFVKQAQASGGVKAKVGAALSDDPDFLRKLKPSLIAARAKGEAPTSEPSGGTRTAPSGPQISRPKQPKSKRSGGTSPWLVIGAALAGGYVLAKLIDWRGHAHPRF